MQFITRIVFLLSVQNMYCSSDIIEKPFILTLTLKLDLDASFVKFDPSQNRIFYGMKMRNQS